jgi:hypothetical protein
VLIRSRTKRHDPREVVLAEERARAPVLPSAASLELLAIVLAVEPASFSEIEGRAAERHAIAQSKFSKNSWWLKTSRPSGMVQPIIAK